MTKDSNCSDWLDKDTMSQGLTTNEATKRYGLVGPNVLDLKRPTVM